MPLSALRVDNIKKIKRQDKQQIKEKQQALITTKTQCLSIFFQKRT